MRSLKPNFRLGELAWTRLALFAVVILSACYAVVSFKTRGLFEYVGLDFRTYYASAEILRAHGAQSVYDLGLQEQYQLPIYRDFAIGTATEFEVIPTPYLPAFIVPFAPFTLVSPLLGVGIWSLINAIVALYYLRRVVRAALPRRSDVSWLYLAAWLPLFLTMLFGQVNVLLAIAIGEFILAMRAGKELRAGLWLALLMIKPQLIPLLVIGLALAKATRPLIGFGLGSLALVAASALFGGFAWMTDLAQLIVRYPAGLPTTYPESMMNWRAFGIISSAIFSGLSPIWTAAAGSLATLFILGRIWSAHGYAFGIRSSTTLAVGVAAALTTSWHTHIHTALALAIALPFVVSETRLRSIQIVAATTPLSAAFLLLALALGAGPAHIVAGFGSLLLCFAFLVWALLHLDEGRAAWRTG